MKTSNLVFEGVDLVNVISKAMGLPTVKASGRKRAPSLTVRRSKTKPGTTAHAWMGENRITMTIGYDSTIHRVVGTLLHEVAHHVCYWEGVGYNDGDPSFARRCHDLHDEWNQRWGSRVCEVSKHISGAYRGRSKCRDYSKAHVPARKGLPKPDKPVHNVTADNCDGKHWWKLAMEIHSGTMEVKVPGTLATEIECRYVECFDGDATEQPERARFVELWKEGRFRRVGKGSQHVFKIPADELMLLREAIDWSVWDFADEPTALRQAGQLVSRLVNVKEA